MPIIYRHNLPSTSTPTRTATRSGILSSLDPVPTDADDSIVLSDLVRTGEASRLRRRGALRLDHGAAGQAQQPQDRNNNPAQTVAGSPTWISDPEPDPDDVPVFARNTDRDRALRYAYVAATGRGRNRSDVYEDGDEAAYTLFCGGEDVEWELESDAGSLPAFEPSTLPLYPLPVSSSTRRPSYRKTKRTNGCGALLHTQATPRRRLGVWTAKSEASSGAVVCLDPSYFDRAAVAKIVRSACGCLREGVGCAVCGNPLGTRYIPCKTAAEGIFSSRTRTRPSQSFRPDGPQYWHAQANLRTRPIPANPPYPHSQHSSPRDPTTSSCPFYVYTFFSTSVTPSPSFVFPPRPALPAQAAPPAPQSQPQSQSQLRYQYQPYPYQALQPVLIGVGRSRSRSPTSPMPVVIINREEPTSPVDAVGSPTIVSSPEAPVAPAAQSPDSPMLSAYDAAAGGGGGGVPRFDTMVFDRVLTASPMPLSDVGESGEEGEEDASGDAYAYRYQYRLRPSGGEPEGEREVSRYGEDAGAGRGRFDADGEIIGDPGSPDKTGEVMLFPER